MKKKNAIMIADTRSALIGNLLVQIQETNKDLFEEAIIYYDKIDEKEKEIMNKIMPCKFIKFEYDLPESVKSKPAFKKFSPLMFARYYMFDLLDDYETMTWIDTDVLICGDISSIIDKAKKNGMSANFEDPINKSYLNTDTVRTSFSTPLEEYDMTKYNMSSGLITVSDNLKDRKKMTKWCFDKTIEYADKLVLPDQGVLNILIQEFDINVASVGENGAYCFYPTYKRDDSKAKIIHAWGARKFWKSWYLYKTYPQWQEYYNKWVKLGGNDYFGEIKPDVSIVIPTFKTNVKYFDLVLDDLLIKQVQASNFQYDNFEIIIVIDGEVSPEFDELIEKYDDPRIVVIKNKERAGIAKSINIGIKEAKGRYIARIDDDDRIMPSRLFKQVCYLDEHKDIQLVSSYFRYFGDMNESRITLDGELCKAWSIFTCPFDHPTIMFRKDYFLKNKLLYDETRSHVEDWELWLRAFDSGMKVGVIPEILYCHRWYNGQAGQNNKTVDMMRELVRINFEKLKVKLTKEDLVIVSPWQGRVNDEQYSRLEEIYEKAIKNNRKIKKYDEKSLRKVFDYRLEEAKSGRLESLIYKEETNLNPEAKQLIVPEKLSHKIKRKILSPFYKPFKRVHYNISSEAVRDNLLYTYDRIENKLNNIKADIDTSMNNNLLAIKDDLLREINKDNEVDKILNNVKVLNKKLEGKITYLHNQIYDIEEKTTNLHDQIYDIEKKYEILYDRTMNNLYFDKKIILFGTSEHSNIGDAAISVGTYEFIRKYFNDYKLIEVSTYEFNDIIDSIKNIVNPDDLIFLQDGGNLGNKYLNEENVRRTVIKTFVNNRIFILPQTIYFDDTKEGKKELEISKEIYNSHKKLTIFTRGKTSLKLAKEYFYNANCIESLDMALNVSYDINSKREGIMCCIRDLTDESGMDKRQYDEIFEIIEKHDNNYEKTNNLWKNDIKKCNRNSVVYNQFQKFGKHELVVTDRLHGLIFSIITNTPCIVFSSYNYKLKEYVEMLGDRKDIVFLDKDIDSLDSVITKMLNNKYNINNEFKENFNNVANIIKGK